MCQELTIFAAVALNMCRQNAPGSVKLSVRCHAYTIGLFVGSIFFFENSVFKS